MGSELKFFGIEVDSRIKELPKSDYEGPVDCPQQSGTEMDEPLPVSYTHLTLPTSDLV